jgi:hypothetical protein
MLLSERRLPVAENAHAGGLETAVPGRGGGGSRGSCELLNSRKISVYVMARLLL